MKKMTCIYSTFLLLTAILMTACGNKSKPASPDAVEPAAEQLIQKGEYLVTIMGCNDCHSPSG